MLVSVAITNVTSTALLVRASVSKPGWIYCAAFAPRPQLRRGTE
jgi:hypothetical protein